MFRSILIPLDGSPMAEQAIVPGGDVARRLGASLTLAVAHPWGPAEDAPFAATEADQAMREAEAGYLEQVGRRVSATFKVPTETILLEGDAATALAGLAGERRSDLVVSSTHGRGVLARALRGGVALRMAHAVACPALLLKPQRDTIATPDPDGFTRIMVALDGSAAAEASIEPALALAADRRVLLVLLRVVSPFELEGPPLLDRRREATRYLNAVADPLERRGVLVDCRVVTRADAGAAIVSLAGRWGADLVALTTRERGEGERMLLGSVADTVVHLARMPVLVCHAVVKATAAESIRDVAALRLALQPPAPLPA